MLVCVVPLAKNMRRIHKQKDLSLADHSCLRCGACVHRDGARGPLPKYCAECRRVVCSERERNARRHRSKQGFAVACRQCGTEWTARCRRSKFCSRRCQYLHSGHIVVIACEECGKPFDVTAALLQKGRKYCTRSCMRKALRSKESTCENCGKIFSRHKHSRDSCLYCTKACYFEAKRAGRVSVTYNYQASWHKGGRYASAPSVRFARSLPKVLRQCLAALLRASSEIEESSLCEVCGKLCVAAGGPYCSRECAKQVRVEASCDKCGKQFLRNGASRTRRCKRCLKGKRNRLATNNRKRCRKYGVPYDPSLSSRVVFEMDQYVCYICKRKTDPSLGHRHPRYPTVDHVVPLSAGIYGHVIGNVRCACSRCNTHKGTDWDKQLSLLTEMPPDTPVRPKSAGPAYHGRNHKNGERR